MPRKKKVTEVEIVQTPSEDKVASPSFYYAVGRRKTSSARVRLYGVADTEVKVGNLTVKKGEIYVNNRPIEQYFRGEAFAKIYLEPFRTTNTMGRFAGTIRVVGGGASGQLAAVIHGISRALAKVDPEKFPTILRKRGFMTRDPREKQRRKAGFAGKARARKQSPKR